MIKKEIEFKFIDPHIHNEIRKSCKEIENFLKKEGIGDTIFSIINELTENAIKANLKRIFFLKNNYPFSNSEEYNKGLKEFKEKYRTLFSDIKKNSNEAKDWLEAINDLGLIVKLEIDITTERILIYIKNNTRILPEEEKKLRESLSIAMKSKDLVEFMLHFGDRVKLLEEEGEGQGMPLIIILIRDMGFSPENFRVYKDEKNTIARIELPLSKDYIPIRKRFEETHNN